MNAMKAQAALTRTLPFSNIDKRVLGIRFGAYGVRAVCTGIYEPGHEATDKNGFAGCSGLCSQSRYADRALKGGDINGFHG
jgi:hypothetical protein